jgi:uncharacterized membrane protein
MHSRGQHAPTLSAPEVANRYGFGPLGVVIRAARRSFVGALTALAVWLLRTTRTSTDQTTAAHAQSTDEVLASRFARGEIDEDDYTRRREVLRNTGTPTLTK